ncbi:hypothetical protein BDV32DRAFT_148256 [Aspergillus pseudonomiae]|uniref:Uncharacterized protein n=1 Tax=Aspergillus pseudonomiae TaxID=1506151 RepID=A0A5N7DKG3_9EURO|nr:uncharacterized protein BDV37DRAFT_242088 [Aspergillus pseudonomiae]KAB8261608.1 hypothetical protein BDV32DRAFT_148256 [Aspergillus pseudonomiae]KAE8406844.1 hypothetical protein BDV37DRAFT_242088 [Aspergillus pseudonomiae]
MPNNKLSGSRILVVGGTSGIGFAIAQLALESNANVIIASSSTSKIQAAIKRLQESCPDSTASIAGHPVALGDETAEENIIKLFEYATSPSLFPPSGQEGDSNTEGKDRILLDHIAFTAGNIPNLHPPTSPSINKAYINSIGDVRVIGAALLAKHSQKYLRQSRSSSITLTSGANVDRPQKGWTFGAMMSGATEGMARGLAVDLAPVRVNVVSPGAVDTEIFDRFGDKREEFMKKFGEQTLTGSVGKPMDIAEAYVYAMRDWNLAGEKIGSNGGRLLHT